MRGCSAMAMLWVVAVTGAVQAQIVSNPVVTQMPIGRTVYYGARPSGPAVSALPPVTITYRAPVMTYRRPIVVAPAVTYRAPAVVYFPPAPVTTYRPVVSGPVGAPVGPGPRVVYRPSLADSARPVTIYGGPVFTTPAVPTTSYYTPYAPYVPYTPAAPSGGGAGCGCSGR